MKKFLNILGSVAIVAALLSGCVKDETTNGVETASKKRIVTITAGADETRTVLSDDNKHVNWDALDYQNMHLIEGYLAGGKFKELQRVTAKEIALGEGDETATFTFELDNAKSGDYAEYEYHAILIYENSELGYGEDAEYYIKNTQDPTPTTIKDGKGSFDPRADVLIAKPQNGFAEPQTSLSFEFARAVAITKMTLKGLGVNELIRSVSFTTNEDFDENDEPIGTPIVGQVRPHYDSEGNCKLGFVGNISGYDNHRVTMSYLDRETIGGEFDVYFAIAPVTLKFNKELTVRVVTTEKYYEKVITLDRDLEFKTDCLNTLSVNMNGYDFTPDRYVLVTDASTLKDGDEIIIAAENSYALGAERSSGNNREAVQINYHSNTHTIDYYDEVQIITLEAGSAEGTFAFNVGDGYLYAAGSGTKSNYLKTQASVDANASWAISIEEKNATIQAQGSNTNNILLYNTNKLFSCYEAFNDSYNKNVRIFRYVQAPSVAPIKDQTVGSEEGNYNIPYVVTGTDDFKVVGVDGCVTHAEIKTRGTITVTVGENTTGKRLKGDVIIESMTHKDVTAKIRIWQKFAGEKTPLNMPENLDFEVTSTNLTAVWDTVKDADKYEYRVEYEGGEIKTGVVDSNELSISDEFAAGEYEFYVKAVAAEDSDYSDSDENKAIFNLKESNNIGEAYSFTFTGKQFSANGTKILDGLSWTIAGDGSYWGYDATKGQQFGSNSKPYKTFTVTLGYDAYCNEKGSLSNVKKITINTSGNSSINASFTVKVGGVQIGEATKISATATNYTFEAEDNNLPAGDVVIGYTQTSSKAIYIKSVSINEGL